MQQIRSAHALKRSHSLAVCVCVAIIEKKLVEITYEGQKRWVQPYVYGMRAGGELVFGAYQIKNFDDETAEPAWKKFSESEIRTYRMINHHFSRRRDYNPQDTHFKKVICQL